MMNKRRISSVDGVQSESGVDLGRAFLVGESRLSNSGFPLSLTIRNGRGEISRRVLRGCGSVKGGPPGGLVHDQSVADVRQAVHESVADAWINCPGANSGVALIASLMRNLPASSTNSVALSLSTDSAALPDNGRIQTHQRV